MAENVSKNFCLMYAFTVPTALEYAKAGIATCLPHLIPALFHFGFKELVAGAHLEAGVCLDGACQHSAERAELGLPRSASVPLQTARDKLAQSSSGLDSVAAV